MSAILMRYWLVSSRKIVANANLGHENAHLGGDVLPNALNSLQQIAAALRIGQSDQADAELDFHRIGGEIIFDPFFGRLLWRPCALSTRPRPFLPSFAGS